MKLSASREIIKNSISAKKVIEKYVKKKKLTGDQIVKKYHKNKRS